MRKTAVILLFALAIVFAQDGTQTEAAPTGQIPQTVSEGTQTEAAPTEQIPQTVSEGTQTSGQGEQTAVQPQDGQDAQSTQETQTCMGGGGIMSFVPMIAIIAIFYFLMIRPQQKQAKMLREMRDAFQKDDRVVTSGGIHGVITNLKGEVITIRIADGVKIDVDRNSLQLDNVSAEGGR
jgi:preprotein translocase subunit YajC